MKIALLEINKPGDNKDFNGGFGTTFNIGNSLKARILSFIRNNLENIPTMSYAYLSSIFKRDGHFVKYYFNELPRDVDFILIYVSLIRHNEEIEIIKRLKSMRGLLEFMGRWLV